MGAWAQGSLSSKVAGAAGNLDLGVIMCIDISNPGCDYLLSVQRDGEAGLLRMEVFRACTSWTLSAGALRRALVREMGMG